MECTKGSDSHRMECTKGRVPKISGKATSGFFKTGGKRSERVLAKQRARRKKQNTMKIDTVNKVIKVYNTREYEEAKDFLADEINQATNIDGWKIEYDTGEE